MSDGNPDVIDMLAGIADDRVAVADGNMRLMDGMPHPLAGGNSADSRLM